jgi:hypothetical protein
MKAYSRDQEITEVLLGVEKAVGRGVRFMAKVKKQMDLCYDHRAPSIVVEVPAYSNGYKAVRSRGGRIRVITEITSHNLRYCKDLLTHVDELRHLKGIVGGIAVSESEFMATTLLEEAKPLSQVVYSNVRAMVLQQQNFFEMLWKNAIPAKERFAQIEQGMCEEEVNTIYFCGQCSEKFLFNEDLECHQNMLSHKGTYQLPLYDK